MGKPLVPLFFVPPTPIKLCVLFAWLKGYPSADAELLRVGFSRGFSLCYDGPRVPRDSLCLASAAVRPQVVRDKLAKEIGLGRIAGPFVQRPLNNLQCSPIGLVPKRQPGTYRLIHHLSFPAGQSVNDFIDHELCAVHYASFDTAVALLLHTGRDAWLAKADIKSAFRLLPVSPLDYDLLGFTFGGLFYYDKCMPMGCAISCSLFEKFSSFIEFHVKRVTGSSLITHYLDDFLFVGPSSSSCLGLLRAFTLACGELGVPLASEKTEGPAQVITYLGLEIDALRAQVRVPPDKVQAMTNQIGVVLSRPKITLVALQSLVGSLNFLCKAVSPGRAFLRRLIALSKGITKPYHKVRLTAGAKLDLLLWREFLSHFNGVSPFLEQEWESSTALDLFTDAAASVGFGAYFQGHWVQGRWPVDCVHNPPSIAFLEFYPVVVALKCWAPQLTNRKVMFHTDNTAVVHIINTQSSRCPKVMQLVRTFVLVCLRFNIRFKAVHVPGVLNVIADSLSRFQASRFRAAAPQADTVMTPLPVLPQVC